MKGLNEQELQMSFILNRLYLLSEGVPVLDRQSGLMSMLNVPVCFLHLCFLLSLCFSVQASSIKEFFVCLDPSWKSMTSRTHLKEVQDFCLVNDLCFCCIVMRSKGLVQWKLIISLYYHHIWLLSFWVFKREIQVKSYAFSVTVPLTSLLCISGNDPLTDEENNHDINSVAGVLKLYFRGLENPLFPKERFNDLLACISKNTHIFIFVRYFYSEGISLLFIMA